MPRPPLCIPFLPAMTILAPLLLLLLAASASGWGSLALPPSSGAPWSRRFGAGILLLFFLTSSAAWAGLLEGWMLWTVLGGGVLLLCWRPGLGLPDGWAWLLLLALPLIPLVMLPPISRDAMNHHLYLPRIWLESGGMARPEWASYFSYPYLVEALYALVGGTVGFQASRAVSLLGFLGIGAVAWEALRRTGGRRVALVGLLVLASIPELVRNATWSYSDTFLAMFALMAYVEMTGERGSPVRAVLWAGAAGCCKYNGILVLAAVLLLLPFRFRLDRRTLGGLLVAAAITSGWWAVPNLLQWGNPVYPLMRGVFGPTVEMTARASEYMAANAYGSPVQGPLDLLLLPVRMSVWGEWDDPSRFDGASGPLLLAGCILSVVLVRRRRWRFAMPLVYLALALVLGGGAVRTRYMIPALVMLSLPAAMALGEGLLARGRSVAILTGVLVLGCSAWSLDRFLDLYVLERPWLLPSREEYLGANTLYWDFYRECAEHVPPSDTTYLVSMDRAFYFPSHAVYDRRRVPLQLLDRLWSGADADSMASWIRSTGAEWVAVDMMWTSANTPTVLEGGGLAEWRRFTAGVLEPVASTDGMVLLRLPD